MTASEIIEAIHAARYTGKKHGLQNTRALLDEIHIPHTPAPAIHVAGTNGKGSVCAMAESGLRAAGLKTGLYTSPFLQVYNERIRLNGSLISDEMLEAYGNPVLEAAQVLAGRGIHVTSFELGTALAFSVFYHEKVDCAVIEVGLGGRLDPSNVVTPRVSVIAALSLDHTQILGNTLEKIAGEKAGIMKPGVPVMALRPRDEAAAQVIREKAEACGSPLYWAEDEQVKRLAVDRYGARLALHSPVAALEARINLPGFHQGSNALLAAGALKLWGLPDGVIRQGLEAARWPARLEWAGNVILDGAHNAQGAEALLAYVKAFLKDEKRVLLTGVLAEKLDEGMLAALAALAPQAVTLTPNSPRALAGEELAKALGQHGCRVQACPSAQSGLAKAKALAGDDGIVICAGSLYVAGEMRSLLGLAAV